MNINKAYKNISNVSKNIPLEFSERLSKIYNNNIFLKREDLQITRSFKARGSFNKIKNIVTASAGNHAQGVAYACQKLNIKGTIILPTNTTKQKIERIKYFGQNNINIKLFGTTIADGNNYITRYNDFIDKNLVYLKLKHYFIINFNQRPEELKKFVNKVLDLDILKKQIIIMVKY